MYRRSKNKMYTKMVVASLLSLGTLGSVAFEYFSEQTDDALTKQLGGQC